MTSILRSTRSGITNNQYVPKRTLMMYWKDPFQEEKQEVEELMRERVPCLIGIYHTCSVNGHDGIVRKCDFLCGINASEWDLFK